MVSNGLTGVAAYLRDQILRLWSQSGDWNQGGIDRAAELARLLEAQGVTDLADLGTTSTTTKEKQITQNLMGTGDNFQLGDPVETEADVIRKFLTVGGKQLGFLGDINRDNTIGRTGESWNGLQSGELGDLLGWSATGKGGVSYLVDTGPDGKPVIRPQWASSSDAGNVQDIAKLAAITFGGGYLMDPTTALPWETLASEGIKQLPASLPGAVPAAGAAITSTVAPLTAAEALAGLGTVASLGSAVPTLASTASAAQGTKSLWDKTTDFFSDPKNILQTVATVGSLYEGLKDDPADPNANFTQTTTKTLDPRLDAAIFGADGKSGLFGDLMAFKDKYPTGQNQTMIDAQNGLRGLLTDPRVMNGYFTMGGTGLGLLNQGIAPNPWKPKG